MEGSCSMSKPRFAPLEEALLVAKNAKVVMILLQSTTSCWISIFQMLWLRRRHVLHRLYHGLSANIVRKIKRVMPPQLPSWTLACDFCYLFIFHATSIQESNDVFFKNAKIGFLDLDVAATLNPSWESYVKRILCLLSCCEKHILVWSRVQRIQGPLSLYEICWHCFQSVRCPWITWGCSR